MSDVAAICHLLTTDADVLAEVPATRIRAGKLPLGTDLPAILVTHISGTEMLTTSMAGARKLRNDRVQVTVKTNDYYDTEALLELARVACRNRAGPINDVDVLSILPAGDGPDLPDADASIYQRSVDFFVRWRTAP